MGVIWNASITESSYGAWGFLAPYFDHAKIHRIPPSSLVNQRQFLLVLKGK